MEKPTVVISDLHGQFEKLTRVVSNYGNDYHYIFNGDLVDRGPDTKKVLDLISSMGRQAIILTGNHEWVLRAALTDADEDRRAVWRDGVWLTRGAQKGLESRTLESYGINSNRSNKYVAASLYQHMIELGHLTLLEEAMPYYEDHQLVVVHAGVASDISWQDQRYSLEVSNKLAKRKTFIDGPPQIFDHKLSENAVMPDDLQNKTLVTGHAHYRWGINGRVLKNYRSGSPYRVHLASNLAAGDPLFVYESETQSVAEF